MRKKYNLAKRWQVNFRWVDYDDVIKPIYRMFIEPCLRAFYPEPEQSRAEILHLLLGVGERSIYCVTVKEPFTLPGQVKDPDTNQLMNPRRAEDRHMKKGQQLWVRFNIKEPQRIEVEVDHLNEVFYLTPLQWTEIKRKLLHVG